MEWMEQVRQSRVLNIFGKAVTNWRNPSRPPTHPLVLFTSYSSFPTPQYSPWTLLGERVDVGRPGEL